MNKKEIIVKNDHEQTATFGAFLIEKIIKQNQNPTTNIAFSGGNTPQLMFEKLSKLTNLNWAKVNIFLVDERYISLDNKNSNFNMIKKHLLNNIDIPSENIKNINYLNDINEAVKEYKNKLIEQFSLTPKNPYPVFDLIHLGIGGDGHTASIFDHQKINKNKLIDITTGKKYKRITFTYKILNHAKNILFLATGKEKKDIIKKVLQKDKRYPAANVETKGNIYFLLDKESASLIKNNKYNNNR
ncbi:MAG: 6-phosphogluconolactonase [Halanaerobiales bacterium]|nr:6-phosphogluconolactonase [Halanaerobiales bacterium]